MARGDKRSKGAKVKARKATMKRLMGAQKANRSVSLSGPDGRKVTNMTRWDHGTGTVAARSGTVKEPVEHLDEKTGKMVNPNNVTRRRRLPQIDQMHASGKISKRALQAATRLLDAQEATQRTAPAIKAVQVDSSPKPDSNVAIMIDRISQLVYVKSRLERGYAKLIEWVVLDNRHLGDMPVCGSREKKRQSVWTKRATDANRVTDVRDRAKAFEAARVEIRSIADDRVKAATCTRVLGQGLEKLADRLGL